MRGGDDSADAGVCGCGCVRVWVCAGAGAGVCGCGCVWVRVCAGAGVCGCGHGVEPGVNGAE